MDQNNLHTIKEVLNGYKPISLSEMDNVKLMDRVDCKFIITVDHLIPILQKISLDYSVLAINNHRVFSYRTEYYDTPELEMFSDHHKGKLNRYKVRQREYIESDLKFLEVKFKSNKGRVIKDRVQIKPQKPYDFNGFIHEHTPYDPDKLNVTLINRFNRFTLVDKNLQERVTIDSNLAFSDPANFIGLNGLVIIELKQNKNSRDSSIYGALKEHGVRPDSFSKYCLGVALLNRHDKFNNFKRTIKLIHKLSRLESAFVTNAS